MLGETFLYKLEVKFGLNSFLSFLRLISNLGVGFTCQYSGWRHIAGNVEDRYLGSGPGRVLISSDSLTELIICILPCQSCSEADFQNKLRDLSSSDFTTCNMVVCLPEGFVF